MSIIEYSKCLLRGVGQVMFMENAMTGALFLVGIMTGTYLCGTSIVAWGAITGLFSATIGGKLLCLEKTDEEKGLWGFNGILIGCALPTFFTNSPFMWIALVLLSALSPLVRFGMNTPLNKIGINSLTFPFIALTWLTFVPFLTPVANAVSTSPPLSLLSLATAWLNGISQVFLVCSPVCGSLFLAGLLVANRRAATWCAIGSIIGLSSAFLFRQDAANALNGLYGFNPALTAIALGAVFRKSVPIAVAGAFVTFLVQLALSFALQEVLPVLTAPFCITTWIFLINWKRSPNKGILAKKH